MHVQTMIQRAKRKGFTTKLVSGNKVKLITSKGDYIMPISGEIRDVYFKINKKPPVKLTAEREQAFVAHLQTILYDKK